MAKKLIIDGNHLAGRCRATMSEMTTSRGKLSGVVFGFTKGLLWAESEAKVPKEDVLICWDYGRCKKRMELFPDYKAGRVPENPTPEEQQALLDYIHQLNALHEGLKFRGVKQVRVRNVEADDLIGIFSRFYEEHNHEVLIYSGDGDMHQLVSHKVKVLDANKGVLDLQKILDSWEVRTTDYIPYWKAIVGDSSDKIPGIRGLGPVRAKLILDVLDLSTSPPCWKSQIPDKTRKYVDEFCKHQDIISRNLQLMTIPRTWDKSFYSKEQQLEALEQLLTSGSHENDLEFVKFLRDWELNSILENYRRW